MGRITGIIVKVCQVDRGSLQCEQSIGAGRGMRRGLDVAYPAPRSCIEHHFALHALRALSSAL